MIIKQNLVSESKYYVKCPYTMDAEFIVVHNTANNASAANEVAYMIRNNKTVSFHYAVDDKEIIQGIPENRNAFHAGDGATGRGNRKGIAVEICYSKSGGVRFEKAEKLAAKFIAFKLKEKGWGIDKVMKHRDFSGKYCPHRTLDMGWQRFLKMIAAELNTEEETVKYYPKYNGATRSIVDALKSLKVDSSFTHRTKIAKANGITLYLGTAKQNTTLLNLLKQGKLIKE